MAESDAPYAEQYYELFSENYRRHANIRARVDRKIARVCKNPYHNTEILGDRSGHLNLRGCRSVRIDRNFRIIFVVCEECRHVPDCNYCFCEIPIPSGGCFVDITSPKEGDVMSRNWMTEQSCS